MYLFINGKIGILHGIPRFLVAYRCNLYIIFLSVFLLQWADKQILATWYLISRFLSMSSFSWCFLMLSSTSNTFFSLSLTVVMAGAAFELRSDKQNLAIWCHGGFSSCCHFSGCLFSVSLLSSTLFSSSNCCGVIIWTYAGIRKYQHARVCCWKWCICVVVCEMFKYNPPSVHRGQILKIWPAFQNLSRGIVTPPNVKYTTSQRMLFWKKLEIYSNIPLHRECPNPKHVSRRILPQQQCTSTCINIVQVLRNS